MLGLEPNWALPPDGYVLTAINLGFFDSKEPAYVGPSRIQFEFSVSLLREILIWAPPGLQELVCVTIQEAGLQSYIRPVVQADTPAGPDGFR